MERDSVFLECLDSKFRGLEAAAAMAGTTAVMAVLDATGRASRISGALDGCLTTMAVFVLMYLAAGVAHDYITAIKQAGKEKHYVTMPWRIEDEAK